MLHRPLDRLYVRLGGDPVFRLSVSCLQAFESDFTLDAMQVDRT